MEPSDHSTQEKVGLLKLIRLRSAPTDSHPRKVAGVISLCEAEKLLDVVTTYSVLAVSPPAPKEHTVNSGHRRYNYRIDLEFVCMSACC